MKILNYLINWLQKLRTKLILKKFGYDEIDDFFNGLACAWKGNEAFHINPDGTPAYDERHHDVTPFFGDTAGASYRGMWYNIKKDGVRYRTT